MIDLFVQCLKGNLAVYQSEISSNLNPLKLC